MENKPMSGSYYQPLFDLLHQEHGITPLESEMTDIIEVVEKMRGKKEGPRWVKAADRNPPVNTRLHLKVKGVNHVGFWDAPANCYVTFLDNAYPIADVEWLDEQPAALKQIDREWICDALIEFTIAYIKSNNKDIANDAAEYLDDKLKEVGIVYMLSESEQPAAGREEDAVAFAEWLYQNRWFQFENGKWYYTFEQGTSMSDKQYQKEYVKTTAQLYELFKQQKEK